MNPPTNIFLRKFKNRNDSEHEQAFTRLIIVSIVFIYILGSSLADSAISKIETQVLVVNIFFLCFSITLIFAIWLKPSRSDFRRIIGIVGDNTVTTYAMYMMGDTGSVLYGVYLWITFGNGLRYGKSFLHICHTASLIGFGFLLFASEYWTHNKILGYGLFTTLIVLPIYVASLLQRLTDAISKANEANSAKSKFLANMSHEMRTPLNGVIGMADLMLLTGINNEQRDYAETIHASANTLLSLINDTLDISKIEAGKLQIENIEFDLHKLLSNTIRVMTPLAAEKNLTLKDSISPEVPYSLFGDPSHLRQILVNLISNAIKFTQEGHVQIVVSNIANTNSSKAKIKFEVSDTGIGISDDAQKKIFDSFTQADDSTTRRFGGTGLGTTISKELIEAMGGTIGLSSKVGVGTTFWFTIEFNLAENTKHFDTSIFNNFQILYLTGPHPQLNPFTDFAKRLEIPVYNFELNDLKDFFNNSIALNTTHFYTIAVDATVVTKSNSSRITELLDMTNIRNAHKILIKSSDHNSAIEKHLQGLFQSVVTTPCEEQTIYNALHAAMPDIDAHNFDSKDSSSHRLKSLNILLADDNPTNLKVIGKMLEKSGHNITHATDGMQALDELENNSYDLGILDMQMPEMDGIEVIKAYRFIKPIDEQIPLIILSANATSKARKDSMDAGACGYLTKPIAMNKLVDAINNIAVKSPSNIALIKEDVVKQTKTDHISAFKGANINNEVLSQIKGLGGDDNFFSELITGYIDDTALLLNDAETSLSKHDYNQFLEIIHAIKGSSGSIGATSVYNQCRKIYHSSEQELKSNAATMLNDLFKYFSTTKKQLQSLSNSTCRNTVA